MNAKVDAYLARAERWRAEFDKLRAIVLVCGLEETLKWGEPCYTAQDRNIVLMHGFKEYCALLFFKGALLQDSAGILVQQTRNVQAARQLRFTNVDEVTARAELIKAYIQEAMVVEASGQQVAFKDTAAFDVPEEFQSRLSADAALSQAFAALTPGRQRAYLLHFSSAKQSRTRQARIDKCLPRILSGKGLDD